jgi:uncharacterized sulfatase
MPVTWGEVGREDLDHIDGGTAEAAARLLAERPADAPPFLLAVGFTKPHSPFAAPAPYFERHDLARVALPEFPADDRDDLPAPALQGAALTRDLAREDWAEILRAYQACVSYVDACVGRVLEALEASPHAANTIVVFTSDHGLLLGEHGLLLKDLLFEETTACPLIVAGPGASAGRSCARLVELVDLFPTLVELCGVALPAGLEGLSFAPLLSDPERPWKRAVFTYTREGTSVRTERWRFTSWGDAGAELYDHAEDPHEFQNLAGEEGSAPVLAEMRALLEGGWRAALPGR